MVVCGEASDGLSACEQIERLLPDVAVMDVSMPGMSGPDLQLELTHRGQKIPIVFITALGDETIRPRLLANGAVECLPKPFSETALLDALNTALRMR